MNLFITSRPDQSAMNNLTLFLLEIQRKKTFFAVNYPGVAHKNGQIKNSNKLIFFMEKGCLFSLRIIRKKVFHIRFVLIKKMG